MLEFRADPESPFHNPAFQKDKTVLIYCGSGGRAALSGKTLKELGYQSVYNAGGFKELADAGLDTEPAKPQGLPLQPPGQLSTKAIASISIMKSGPARRRTSTVVLVGVAGPK